MTWQTDMDHLPMVIRQELHRITAILFEAFDEMMKGRLSEQYRAGHILTVILHGAHIAQEWEYVLPGEAYSLLAVVNHGRLARRKRDWRPVIDRLQRAWEHGEISRPVRLTVESLDSINRALSAGVPYFVTIADKGIALYPAVGMRLETPHRLPSSERRVQGRAEFARWYRSGCDFLSGAGFYRGQGNAPIAALMLHQACEHFYICVARSLSLHAPRTHALDVLREIAETLDVRLRTVWPRETRFERRVFGCIRRAYVEARYGESYRITPQELAWAFVRVEALGEQVRRVCADHGLTSDRVSKAVPLLGLMSQLPAVPPVTLHEGMSLRRVGPIARHRSAAPFRWARLAGVGRPLFSNFFERMLGGFSIGILWFCLFAAGVDVALWYAPAIGPSSTGRAEPADPSAVLDFNVHADTVLGAVDEIANRAGYRVRSNDDVWTVRWTGAYRAKATTFDALADVLYGSGLCPAIRDDLITVRYCNKASLNAPANFIG